MTLECKVTPAIRREFPGGRLTEKRFDFSMENTLMENVTEGEIRLFLEENYKGYDVHRLLWHIKDLKIGQGIGTTFDLEGLSKMEECSKDYTEKYMKNAPGTKGKTGGIYYT
jgi:hypothetical protein